MLPKKSGILLLCHVSNIEFDFKPKGHLEIGEGLDIIRQRLDVFSVMFQF